jgi:hypothetical protein
LLNFTMILLKLWYYIDISLSPNFNISLLILFWKSEPPLILH